MTFLIVGGIILWFVCGVMAAGWYTRLRVEHRDSFRNCEKCAENRGRASYVWVCADHAGFNEEYDNVLLVAGGVIALIAVMIYIFTRAVAVATEKKISLRKELEKECRAAEAVIDDLFKNEATP